jgi:hypothetical protein
MPAGGVKVCEPEVNFTSQIPVETRVAPVPHPLAAKAEDAKPAVRLIPERATALTPRARMRVEVMCSD